MASEDRWRMFALTTSEAVRVARMATMSRSITDIKFMALLENEWVISRHFRALAAYT